MHDSRPDLAANPALSVPTMNEALELEPLQVTVTLPPRIARRLLARAFSEKRPTERVASRLLAQALIPDVRERRRVVGPDLDDVLGADRHDDMATEEQA